jgi:CBS domain-containing protein
MRVERVPIRSTVHIARGGVRERRLSIYCPFKHRSFDLAHCRTCSHLASWPEDADDREAHLVCRADEAELETRVVAVHVGERLGGSLESAAAATPIGVVMASCTIAVRDDLALEELRETIGARTGTALPVVSEDGRLLGVVAMDAAAPRPPGPKKAIEDLLRRVVPSTVREVMTAHVVAFPESGRVRDALNAMLVERVRYLPVVAEDGAVVGMVWDLDLLTWLARGAREGGHP